MIAEVKEGEKVLRAIIIKDAFKDEDIPFAYIVLAVKGSEALNGATSVQSAANTQSFIDLLDSLITELDFNINTILEFCNKILTNNSASSYYLLFGLDTDALYDYSKSLVPNR